MMLADTCLCAGRLLLYCRYDECDSDGWKWNDSSQPLTQNTTPHHSAPDVTPIFHSLTRPCLPPPEKRRELHHPDARFLIATPFPASSPSPPPPTLPTASPIGFLHLRYLLENELPVLYAYEMQVADDWQRLGLGSQLMRVGQLLSVQAGMACVMLTVFKRNVAGMQLYKKTLGYVVDELSQSDHEGEDYEVLSKKNPKFVAG